MLVRSKEGNDTLCFDQFKKKNHKANLCHIILLLQFPHLAINLTEADRVNRNLFYVSSESISTSSHKRIQVINWIWWQITNVKSKEQRNTLVLFTSILLVGLCFECWGLAKRPVILLSSPRCHCCVHSVGGNGISLQWVPCTTLVAEISRCPLNIF